MNQNNNEFDFSRNDKFFTLTIPKHSLDDDTVLYEFHLKDLVSNREYIQNFRFKELKEIHENLSVLKVFIILLSSNFHNFLRHIFGKKPIKTQQ